MFLFLRFGGSCHFVLFILSFSVQTFIQFIHPVAGVSLHFLRCSLLSGKNLPGVPSRDLNSGLPYKQAGGWCTIN